MPAIAMPTLVGQALAERPGGRFDAGGHAVFRMARAAAAGLAEMS